ncbi:PAS domain S-box protein [Lentzea tibetensis]|uniref:histidine kinase n=1 Tax=Lentzea tibetensis TaxID=2591470 RepID=A0A563EXU7_9PSEU|nr:ATP-binding protein [Lentzea tibetensis]TWP52382.1 PAS domain S-box protein [Lentzea tibetensis]
MRTAEGLVATGPYCLDDAVLIATALGRVPIAGVALLERDELRLREVRGMPPDRYGELLPLCQQTVDADDLVVFARPRRSTGRVVHYYAGVPIRADDRRPVGVVFIAAYDAPHFDHVAHDALWVLGRQVERQLEAEWAGKATDLLSRVVSTAHGASGVGEALRSCLEEVCAFAEWPVGHAYVPADDGTGELMSSGVWHCADERRFTRLRDVTGAARVAPGAGLPGEVAATMCPKWMDRLDLAEIGVSSAFAFPVCANGELVAVLEFFHDDIRSPSPHLLDVVTELGRELGVAATRISDRARLRDTVHQLRKIIGTAHDAFVALDGDGLVTEWNEAAERMFGWRREQMLGVSLADRVVPDRYREEHVAGIARLKATGEGPVLGRQVELSAVRKNGQEFPIELLVWEPQSSDVYRFNAFVRDISDRKEAERALHAAYAREQEVVEELRRLDRTKTDFIANVSHELRTPLTSISGYLELLVDGAAGELSGEQLDLTSVMQRNTQRLLRLVKDILTVGKMDSGQFRPDLVPTDLGALVAAAVKSVEPEAVGKAINLVSQVGPDQITVPADPNQLDRALLNLLSNAVKFTRPAGSVAVRVRRIGNEARITVADTGIGIPADELPRLFDRFFRSSLAADNEIQGTGLGLAIVKHIVEQHGGAISVTSRPGEGTMVAVVLPICGPQP